MLIDNKKVKRRLNPYKCTEDQMRRKEASQCDVCESRVREFHRNFGFIETEIPEEMQEVTSA